MRFLWLDDDSPDTEIRIDDVFVTTAQTCKQAEDFLIRQRDSPPAWIIVDFVVPQAGWKSSEPKAPDLLRVPGLEFIKHVRKSFGTKVGVAAYGIGVPSFMRKAARDAGADVIFEKMSSPFTEVVKQLKQRHA